jgi:hypothetical protein
MRCLKAEQQGGDVRLMEDEVTRHPLSEVLCTVMICMKTLYHNYKIDATASVISVQGQCIGSSTSAHYTPPTGPRKPGAR